jgi:hypothetical protein
MLTRQSGQALEGKNKHQLGLSTAEGEGTGPRNGERRGEEF